MGGIRKVSKQKSLERIRNNITEVEGQLRGSCEPYRVKTLDNVDELFDFFNYCRNHNISLSGENPNGYEREDWLRFKKDYKKLDPITKREFHRYIAGLVNRERLEFDLMRLRLAEGLVSISWDKDLIHYLGMSLAEYNTLDKKTQTVARQKMEERYLERHRDEFVHEGRLEFRNDDVPKFLRNLRRQERRSLENPSPAKWTCGSYAA